MKKKQSNYGFTLTEVLIVVGIIVFLLVSAIVFLRLQILKGNDARRKGDLHEIQIAVEEYEKDNDCYPLPQFVICSPGTGLMPYVSKIPCDPTTKASYYYEHEDSVCPSWYRIFSILENEHDEDLIASIGPLGSYNYYLSSPNAPDPESSDGDDNGNGGGKEGGEGEGGGLHKGFYGCISGICTPILWDPERPGPECDPNYQNPNCYKQCGSPTAECTPWN